MGGYLASREVLTAADRRQINYASGRYSADVCISRSHPGDGHVRASLLVLRFGRPFVVFSPSASETLSCWRPQSFCDPPTSPLCFVWGGVSPAESCVRGAPLCEYSLHTSRTRSTREWGNPSYQRNPRSAETTETRDFNPRRTVFTL